MSRYSDYVEKLVPPWPIAPTDWVYVRKEFDDLIEGDIIAGNMEGPEKYPQIRKTIRIKHDGGTLHISEYVHDRKGEASRIIQFSYDWQYNSGNPQACWKFHYDTYHPEKYWPSTKQFHEHDQPTPLKSDQRRLSNYNHRDVCSVLSTIRVALRVAGKIPIT